MWKPEAHPDDGEADSVCGVCRSGRVHPGALRRPRASQILLRSMYLMTVPRAILGIRSIEDRLKYGLRSTHVDTGALTDCLVLRTPYSVALGNTHRSPCRSPHRGFGRAVAGAVEAGDEWSHGRLERGW